ncbi:MAG: DUF2597 family protein [Pseudodesulfovibrio sp.]|uniref:Prophage PSPPH06, tail tube protein n=1 Tax=Pseudodesulfovibrio aespoeensis (strain ATCC 700646 / DSM 10631 / Aspo-2) TaxID=643562 RepID=E6VXL9_PSEA9|nr:MULTISPECIES: DUF2597 family protein [Pseudodesulfovibrio]MBU4192320.1 DUF2597 family protein [Pseudomonadota bacterium]ADU61477.1 Protein of unknown function DUF2597 [Pseudodesulfovibrio aespoeensis Aspo-2]MBU4244508.1 DUF2597 family protein [Pseudomonadota bacterium]MBU4379858.1 DUF2597 family protein [Pseudomonadota bacterium]MBU4475224.1 DUF2597 family protein [Pseudomonadota bacterium]
MNRISGKSFDINIGDMLVHVDKATLSITDNSAVAKDRGVPNGRVPGDVEAAGEVEVDATALNLIIEAARSAGSFRDLDTFDILFYANSGSGEELKVEAFGCAFKIESLLDIDSKGGEKHITKLPFDVTSPDFIRINGVPYLSASETKDLI